jgi:copper transport protein
MKRLCMMAIVAGLGLSGVAGAHAHLRLSTPANHGKVEQAPKTLLLEFNEAVQLTLLTIQKGDGAPTTLGPLSSVPTKKLSLALPPLVSGSYIVKWRAISDDGHIMADKLVFEVGMPSPVRVPGK